MRDPTYMEVGGGGLEREEHFPTQGEGSLHAECLAVQTSLTLVCHMIDDDISA